MVSFKFKFENFIPCIKCYDNCHNKDYLRCNVCRKGCHSSCLKITEKRFNELSKYETDMFVCGNKCESGCLPFQSLTNKVFLDTTVGKRKLPCKICLRECANSQNTVKCYVCMKWHHTECIPANLTSNLSLLSYYNSFICSDICKIRSMPFSKLDNIELHKEISSNLPAIAEIHTHISENTSSNSGIPHTVNDAKDSNAVIDTFSQVYCEYASQNNVPNILNLGDPTNITVFHANVVSLKKNLNLVEDVFENCNNAPSIIAISETGLNDHIETDTVSLQGYQFERNDSELLKGGVGLYINNDLDYKIRNDLKLNVYCCEDLWVDISLKGNNNQSKKNKESLVIGVIYRHPNRSYSSFSKILCQKIEKLNKDKKNFMIVGDFNINLLKYKLVRNVTDYVNKIRSCGCNVHCNLPTRMVKNSKSCIDHVYSNFDQHNIETSVILSDISDHFSTLTKISNVRNHSKQIKNVYKRKFKLSEHDEANMLNDLENLFSSEAIQRLQACPNVMAKIIIQAYQNLINKYFPLKKVSKRGLKFISKPWLTRGLKISIKKKNKLRCKLKNKYSVEAEKYFKRYRNILTKLKTKAFNNYYTEKAAAARDNISKSWTIINEITKRKKVAKNTISSIHTKEGKEITNQSEISNLLNLHFSTIGKNMAENCATANIDPLSYINHDELGSLFMSPTSPDEIMKLIDSLDLKKAAGSDGIPSHLIKKTKAIIAPILSRLFNVCINKSIFPDAFKIAEVKPLFKGGNRHILGNYRPISLLPQFGKMFEKIIAKRVTSFFESKNILTSHQFGFRKSFSTELAAVDLYDNLLKNLDNKHFTCAIFLDLAKAFDSVNHEILLEKLKKYGVRGPCLDLFKSYLSNRWQYVNLSDEKSDLKLIDIGIPQGSILGPLLFLIYINDLPNASNFFVKLFADDTFLSLSCPNFTKLKKKTKAEIRKIYNWLIANKLTLNIKKSKFMIISNRREANQRFQIKINGHALERCSSYKYLGLFIDNGLNWKNHVNHVCQKISKACGIISKLRHCVDFNTLKTVYFALGYSYLRYCNIVWGNASKNVLKPLTVLQNRIIRIMTFAPFGRIDIDDLYSQVKLLDIAKIHYLEKAKFMYKYHNNKLPANFSNYFQIQAAVTHSYNLRNRSQNRRILSNYAEKMIKHNGVDIWNTIPPEIKSCQNLKSFSNKLKKDILLV